MILVEEVKVFVVEDVNDVYGNVVDVDVLVDWIGVGEELFGNGFVDDVDFGGGVDVVFGEKFIIGYGLGVNVEVVGGDVGNECVLVEVVGEDLLVVLYFDVYVDGVGNFEFDSVSVFDR